MSSNNTIFTGTSRYSTDFQQIIDRAVAIASLPLAQLQSQKTALEEQASALASLEATFTSLQSAVQGLASAVSTGRYTTSVSDGTVVRSSVSGSVLPGVYTVDVIALGAFTSAMSADGLLSVADPSEESISAATTFTLTVDGVEYAIAPESNSLNALAEAINESDAEVEATIINIGTSSSPDYRLSIRSSGLGPVAVQLNDGAADLLNTLATGTLGSYKVNGQPTVPIATDSRVVTLAPGLSLTLLEVGTAEITVARDTGAIGSTVAAFATAYNAAVDQMDRHRGEEGGVLAGNSILYTLSASLREITGYSSEAVDISSLAALGLTFDDQGKLSFDSSLFSEAASTQYAQLLDFLGGATTSGFLATATGVLDGLEDSTDGVLRTVVTSLDDQIAWQAERIDEEQARVDQLDENLRAKMAAADALIASLEQQANYMTRLFQSMLATRESWR